MVTLWETSHRNTTIISEAPVIELNGVSYDCLEVRKKSYMQCKTKSEQAHQSNNNHIILCLLSPGFFKESEEVTPCHKGTHNGRSPAPKVFSLLYTITHILTYSHINLCQRHRYLAHGSGLFSSSAHLFQSHIISLNSLFTLLKFQTQVAWKESGPPKQPKKRKKRRSQRNKSEKRKAKNQKQKQRVIENNI